MNMIDQPLRKARILGCSHCEWCNAAEHERWRSNLRSRSAAVIIATKVVRYYLNWKSCSHLHLVQLHKTQVYQTILVSGHWATLYNSQDIRRASRNSDWAEAFDA